MIAEAHDKDLLTLIIFIVTNKIKNLIEEEMSKLERTQEPVYNKLLRQSFHRLLKTAFEECDAEDDRNIPKNCSREVCESCAEMKGYNASNQAHREKQEQLLESLNPPQGN